MAYGPDLPIKGSEAVVEVSMRGLTVPAWETGMEYVAVREVGGVVVRYWGSGQMNGAFFSCGVGHVVGSERD